MLNIKLLTELKFKKGHRQGAKGGWQQYAGEIPGCFIIELIAHFVHQILLSPLLVASFIV